MLQIEAQGKHVGSYPREVYDEPRHRIAGLGASQGAARSQGQYGLTASPDSVQTEGGTGSGKPGRHISENAVAFSI